MKVAVLNVAVGGAGSWYGDGQDRLGKTLWEKNRRHPFAKHQVYSLFWKGNYPPGSPRHEDTPYAFKPWAFAQAMEQGYDAAIWLDASMWLAGSIDPIIDHIEQHGAATWLAGWSLGQWCHDAGLAKLEVTRDDAMQIPLVCGGICGFDLRTPMAQRFLREWLAYAQDGVSFKGAWNNEGYVCSTDKRCLGHRHDMPTLGWLCRQYGVQPIHCPKWFAYSTDAVPAAPEALVLARGM